MMFEAAEVGHKISKAEFDTQIPALRVDLINAQYDLQDADFPVILLLAGDDRPGRSALLHTLHQVMDARYLETNALGSATKEERERPRFWRYWRRLPRRGRMGAFLGAWPIDVLGDRLTDRLNDEQLNDEIAHIRRFEQALVDGGALLLKFWLHLPKPQHKKRLKQARKHPERAWRLDAVDRTIYQRYDTLLPIAERVVRETSTGEAPWHLIESTDARYRDLRVGRIIQAGLARRLAAANGTMAPAADQDQAPMIDASRTVLDTLDLSQTIPEAAYRQELGRYQEKLSRLTRKARVRGLSSMLVFEGWDAAGKGGAIRRLTIAMDPENYQVIPIAAPTEEEQAHHYLWRFWHHLPRAGQSTIFDRSWYGRVLVERVEGFADEWAWRRAYSEINDFEKQVCDHGTVLLKFWIHIDPDEQLRRFRAREEMPYKKHKISTEDYRNRHKWRAYELAVNEMVARTSTTYAPWHLVAGNDKRWARLTILKTYCHALSKQLTSRS